VEHQSFADRFTESPWKRLYKFPPTIGAPGKAPILFIGINPRRTDNLEIHDFAMRSKANFKRLSRNIDHHHQPYIAPPSFPTAWEREDHYDRHIEIVDRTFRLPFGKVAAVTEMFLCATPKGTGLYTSDSRCAKEYLLRTIQQVQPAFIVTFGARTPLYFSQKIRNLKANIASLKASPIHLPFPSWRWRDTMDEAVTWAVDVINAVRQDQQPPNRNWQWPSPTEDTRTPKSVVRY
jgi:hypothetical protein